MSTSTYDIIKSAARSVGIIAPHEPIQDDDLQDMLEVFNMMVDSWGTSNISNRVSTEETFNLQGGTRQYQWGIGAPAGNFNSLRPTLIRAAQIIYPATSNNLTLPVDVTWSENQYFSQTDRLDPTGGLPNALFYDAQFPFGIVNIYPVPDQAYQLVIRSLKPFGESNIVQNILNVEAIYFKCLKYNLAIELALEYGRPVDPRIDKIADKSYKELLKVCAPKTFMRSNYPTKPAGTASIWTIGNF